jgi:diguanylate cyclase (GGDEF)-like protein
VFRNEKLTNPARACFFSIGYPPAAQPFCNAVESIVWDRTSSAELFTMRLPSFKRNADYDAGDTVLRSMAGLFRQHFRGEDVVCRYGGEEFAFILPESSAKNAAKRVGELRQAAKRHKITYKEQVLDAVTFSVGIAAYPENGLTGEVLLQTADACLYESKANGRDCVTIATSRNWHPPPRKRGGFPE